MSGKNPAPPPPVSTHFYILTASYSSPTGKFVSTQRGNYYGLGGGDPCYWKDEVAAFQATYQEKQSQDLTQPGILATFLEFEKDKVRVQMETAVKMCEFERQGITTFLPPTHKPEHTFQEPRPSNGALCCSQIAHTSSCSHRSDSASGGTRRNTTPTAHFNPGKMQTVFYPPDPGRCA